MSRTIQWLNENSYRAYPFVEDSNMTAVSLSDTLVIPTSAILDFSLVNYTMTGRPVRLINLEITSDVVPQGIFTFRYDSNATFSLAVPASAVLPYTAVLAVDSVHRIVCVFGSGIPALLANPAGVYTLTTPAAIEPALLGFQGSNRVNSLLGTGLGSAPATGLVQLVEGYNCSINVDTANKVITLAAVYGAGAGVDCSPLVSSNPTCSDVLLSINGLHADDNGNFDLIGGQGVTIVPSKSEAKVTVQGAKKLNELRCG